MRGLQAYKTFCGLTNHFRTDSKYDGWKYNFSVKMATETFAAKKNVIYQFAAIEAEYPSINDQLKFFYPAFASRNYVAANMKVIRAASKEFNAYVSDIEQSFTVTLKTVKKEVDSFKGLFDNSSLLPKIYDVVNDGVISYRDAVVLFIVIPDLNNVVSNEPFVYQKWKARIDLHKRFYSLFIEPHVLKTLRFAVVDAYKD